ncbi:MAG TPA: sensor histidine kinase [Lacunisphaera sp.]
MRQLLPQFNPGRLAPRRDAWVLRILTDPPGNRLTRALIVAAYIVGLGIVDYFTGTTLSLQVFYLAPIALALAWLGFPAAVVASVCSIAARVGGDYILGAEYTRRPSIVWNTLGFLATYVILAWILQAFITLRRELEERVNSRTAALATEVLAREKLQQELIEISERERRTIGNDLHDGLGQHLTAMAFAAEVLTTQLAKNDPLAGKTARDIVRLAEEGIHQSRQLARGLLLTAIEPANLNRELEELAASVQRQTGVRCHYDAKRPPLVGDSRTASHIFRIAQEAVRNSIRHAQPTALNLSLSGENESLVLSISDNGAGLPKTAKKDAGVGLRVMAHRAKLIGGDFTLESIPGKGTHIRCRVPLWAASPDSLVT